MTLVLSFVLCFLSAFSARAERAQWGYCNGNIYDGKQGAAVGRSGSNCWVDCCIRIPQEKIAAFAGNRISAVRVGLLDTAPQLDSIVVWVRSAKEEGNLIEAKTYGVQEGWNEVALPASGYDIDGSTDVYVGFSYFQKKKITAISLYGSSNSDGAWTCLNNKWDNGYSSRGSLSVEAVIEGDKLPHNSVVLTAASMPLTRYRLGETVGIVASVYNPAIDTLRSVLFAYSFDGATEVAGYDTVAISLPFLCSESVRVSVPSEGLSAGAHTVHIRPVLPAETPADIAESGSADLTVTLVEGAYPRKAVIEEFTAESCSNCPDGAATIHEAIDGSEVSDRVIMLCHHSGYDRDWLSNEVAQAYEWFYLTGAFAPAMMLDRTYIDGLSRSAVASDGSIVRSAISSVATATTIRGNFENHIKEMSSVGLTVTATRDDEGIHIAVVGERNESFVEECAAPRLTVLVKENNIVARAQLGASGQYIHNDVVRTAASDTWGDSIVWRGNSFTATYTVHPDAEWDLSQLDVVAFVGAYSDNNRAGCQIFNAAATAVQASDGSAIEAVQVPIAAVVSQYYTSLSGARVAGGAAAGIYLRHTRFADGSVRTDKVFVK
jgi:hypothetical protein